MTVAELIENLKRFDPTAEVVLRDLNGLNWFFESKMLKAEENRLVIDSEKIKTRLIQK